MKSKKKIIKSLISEGKYQEFISKILNLATEKKSSYVCIANVHMTIEAYQDVNFCNVVNEAVIVTPDGMPLAKAMKLLYDIDQDRVAGMDLMPDLMKVSEQKELSIYLYGSTEDILDKIINKAKEEFPDLTLYAYSPPFRPLTDEEKNNVVDEINNKNPDFVFVALGCPKQEKWMAEHKDKIHSCMIGLGGALEVYAGVKNRAPKWVQDYSLEWMYRLAQDPRRLWKRYLVTNTWFVFLLLIQIVKVRVFRHDT